MIKVKAKDHESLDQMLRRFKRLCDREGIIKNLKRTGYYEKPSEVRRRKERQAIRKAQQVSQES